MAMKQLKVVGALGATIPAGMVVGLSAEQADRRAHLLESVDENGDRVEREVGAPLEDGLYRATAPLTFKQDELVGISGDLEKGMIHPSAWGDPTEDELEPEEAPAEGEAPKPRKRKAKK